MEFPPFFSIKFSVKENDVLYEIPNPLGRTNPFQNYIKIQQARFCVLYFFCGIFCGVYSCMLVLIQFKFHWLTEILMYSIFSVLSWSLTSGWSNRCARWVLWYAWIVCLYFHYLASLKGSLQLHVNWELINAYVTPLWNSRSPWHLLAVIFSLYFIVLLREDIFSHDVSHRLD